MSRLMRCVQLMDVGRLEARDVPIPAQQPESRVLQVLCCALCRTDVKMWRQGHRDLIVPRILGHEVCVRDTDGGERYVVWPGTACGKCRFCLREQENLCEGMTIMGFHRDGGLAERVGVPETSLIPVPSSLTEKVAVLAEPLACAINVLEQVRLTAGEQFLIYGGGPLGLLMALAGKARGAIPLVVEILPERLQRGEAFCHELDIESSLDSLKADYPVAVNAAPGVDAFSDGLSRLEPGGRYGFFSGLTGGMSLDPAILNRIHYRQLEVVGAYGCTRKQMKTALQILDEYQEIVRLLVDREIALEAVPEFFDAIARKEVMKIIVSPCRI